MFLRFWTSTWGLGLLDPADEMLDFVLKRENVRPISIFRIREDFFLCYNEFGFYVNKVGYRCRGDWTVTWSGAPQSFSYIPPYILAFDPSFVEIRHVETGELQQIIPTNNLRTLNVNVDALHCVVDLSSDFQQVFRLRLIE